MTARLAGGLKVVGVGGMAVGEAPEELVTYALGSCVGVAAWDARRRVGGLWHVMLPESKVNPERALREPGAFADSGAAAFAEALRGLGADLRRMKVWLAGGAESARLMAGFEIGRRNILAVRRQLWTHGLLVDAEDCGGTASRTVRLNLEEGKVQVRRPDTTLTFGG